MFKQILDGHTFLELLIKESRNVVPSQKLRQLYAGFHSVDQEYRCGQRISSHLRVLNLIALGIKETVNIDYGSPILKVIQ
jgi:hypothetical protein